MESPSIEKYLFLYVSFTTLPPYVSYSLTKAGKKPTISQGNKTKKRWIEAISVFYHTCRAPHLFLCFGIIIHIFPFVNRILKIFLKFFSAYLSHPSLLLINEFIIDAFFQKVFKVFTVLSQSATDKRFGISRFHRRIGKRNRSAM